MMKDNFSQQADIYAKYRPHYPSALFDFILQHVSVRQTAWDCATGNGQTANTLAGFFNQVFATDISQTQIDHAPTNKNIFYSVQPAERTNFNDNTFDLVTVSQALHWFATDTFYREVKRVSKPGGIFAAWSYSLLSIEPEIDKVITAFYENIVGPFWDPERRYVDEKYLTIPFPFEEIFAPAFEMQYAWTLDELEGYINTWSATQKYIRSKLFNPVPELIGQLRPLWKSGSKKARFPLHVRTGRV